MFTNFIYFIIALVIYSTYPFVEDTWFTSFETLVLFSALIILFTIITYYQFRRLEKQIAAIFPYPEQVYSGIPTWERHGFSLLDHNFTVIQTRQFIMAILLFAVDIYGLNLPSFFIDFPLFKVIPTFQALLFLGLFAFYLAIVWRCAYRSYQKLHATDMSGRSYVLSNILFAVPVLLPWVALSGIADVINALPYQTPKHLLATTEGEIIYFLVFLFIVAVAGPLMIRTFWRCKPLEPGEHRTRIENICRKAGVECANILYWPLFGGRIITAGVMGLVKQFRYILVTDGLLRYLEPEEIEAVITHEIGHVKKKHLLCYLFFLLGYMFILYALAEPVCKLISIRTFLTQESVTHLLCGLFTILIFLIYFRYIFGYFMRNFERQADMYIYTLSDNAMPLISTFEKITLKTGENPDKPNWHHFSISERIGFIKKCETDRTWITRHERKIRKSIGVWVVGMILIGILGYFINFGEPGKKLSDRFFENAVRQAIAENPDDPQLYRIMGDIYYHNKDYTEAAAAYQQSLALRPDNSHVLNNLAWLYVTCNDKSIRNPESALILAKKAVALEQAPHILDTLAESYYANGQFEEAVAAGKRALKLSGKSLPGTDQAPRSYYEEQLEKFTSAGER